MPTYNITDPNTNKTIKITGDSPPTEQELNDIFSKVSSGEQQAPEQQTSEQMPIEKQRESFDFMSPVPTKEQRDKLNVMGEAKGVLGRGLGNLLALSQREEGVATVMLQNLIDIAAKKGSVMENIKDIGKESLDVAQGETVPELGDIAREAGLPEKLSSFIGLAASFGLPSNILAGGVGKKVAQPITKSGKVSKLSKGIGKLLGVEAEVLDEIVTLPGGYRGVINKRYKNKKIPSMMVDYIESNSEKVLDKIGTEYDKIVPVLQGSIVQNAQALKDDFAKLPVFNKFLTKGSGQPRIKTIMESVENADIKSLDDVWTLRKELDKEIFTAKGLKESVKNLKQVRNKLTDYLHNNPQFKQLDDQYANITEIMKDIGDKVIGDKGENLLGRFNKLTEKERRKLIKLESNLEGANFIDVIKKFALNQELDPRLGRGSLSTSIARERLALPAFRAGLRASEPARKLLGALLKGTAQGTAPVARQTTNPQTGQ